MLNLERKQLYKSSCQNHLFLNSTKTIPLELTWASYETYVRLDWCELTILSRTLTVVIASPILAKD